MEVEGRYRIRPSRLLHQPEERKVTVSESVFVVSRRWETVEVQRLDETASDAQ